MHALISHDNFMNCLRAVSQATVGLNVGKKESKIPMAYNNTVFFSHTKPHVGDGGSKLSLFITQIYILLHTICSTFGT